MEEIEKNENKTSSGLSIFIDILEFSKKVKKAKTFKEIHKLKQELDTVRNAFDYKTLKYTQGFSDETRFAFSDSIITFIPLKSRSTDCLGIFDAILSEISALAYNQIICIQNNIFIRGGISLGWYYEDGEDFISDALCHAVEIEKNISFPLIGVSNEVVKYFSKQEGRKY